MTQNLNRLFDDKDDGNKEKRLSTEQYQHRLQQLIEKIILDFNSADILAFQEVENINILKDAAERLEKQYHQIYRAILVEGNDSSGIDVGYLIKRPWEIRSIQALFKNRKQSLQENHLFSRPPLKLELCLSECITLINLHLRSMRGLRSPKKSRQVALKRQLQAETLAEWINQFQSKQPHSPLIVLGDLNALQPSDRYVDTVGTIIGRPDYLRPKWKSSDLIQEDLIDITLKVPAQKRHSFIYRGNRQQLDYILVSQDLKNRVRSVSFSAIDYSFSDHAAVRAEISIH